MTIRFSFHNLIDDATLTPSSQVASLPASNLQNPSPTIIWRTTDKDSENLLVDLGDPQNSSLIVLLNHNLKPDANITLQANSSDSWSSPPFAQTLNWHEYLIIKYFDQALYRYWRLLISDSTNQDGYIQIGRLWIGTFYQPTHDISRNFTVEHVDPSIVSYSASGTKYVTQRTPFRRLNISFQNTNQKAQFDEILEATKSFKDFIISIDPENSVWQTGIHDYSIYCHLENTPDWKHILNDRWALNLSLRETV